MRTEHAYRDVVRTFEVRIEETETGLFVATSSDLSGLLVAVSSMSEMSEAIVEQAALLIQAETGEAVVVRPARRAGERRQSLFSSWAAIPQGAEATV